MLLEFRAKNYKSFMDEMVFSMMAAPKQKGLDYSLQTVRIKGKNIKGLCSSVIYGANAAGKTNIIGAMDTFKAIILRGNIGNTKEKTLSNVAASMLEVIPNSSIEHSEPVKFSIDFIENNLHIHYATTLDIGGFLDNECERKVLEEELSVNGEEVFSRKKELIFGNMKVIKDYLTDNFELDGESTIRISNNSLDDKELYLTNGFKLIYSQKLVKLITNWFANKFTTVCRADSMQSMERLVAAEEQTAYIEKTTNAAAKLFGINSNALGYMVEEENKDARLFSIFNNLKGHKNVAMIAELFESYGTIRFINIFHLVVEAILTGTTLVVDEFDASIHPKALMSIINIFHNDDINIHHAQLIFNTHNPIFLNSNLFRRDEIKFVERDESSGMSILYALSDFGTTGEKGVRKHEDYMKNYFVNQYGAIKDIDFTPIFEELIYREVKDNDGKEKVH